jgi:hypothetical protein
MTWNDIPRNPSAKTLRQFAGLCLLCFGTLGVWHLSQGRTTLGICLLLAASVGLPGLVWPKSLRRIFVGWMMLVFPIGWVVSHVLLSVVYYGLFTPMAVLFRLRGRDALRLRPEKMDSYWQVKAQPAGVASYFRQF